MQKWPVVKEKHVKQSQELMYYLCLNLMMTAKFRKKLLVITEIWSWLPTWLDGRKARSQEHNISLINIYNQPHHYH